MVYYIIITPFSVFLLLVVFSMIVNDFPGLIRTAFIYSVPKSIPNTEH